MAALATSGVAGFLTVAGGVLSAVGGVTGNKKLTKVGGIMSLGGALVSGFNSIASASQAGGEASAAWDGAGSAQGSDAAQFGKYATDGGTSMVEAATGGAPVGTEIGSFGGGDWDVAGAVEPYAGPGSSTAVAANSAKPQGMIGDAINRVGDPTNKVGDAVNKIGQHVKANKELYSLGGSMLQGMFGPQAEALDLQKSEIERRRRNLNHIVRVGG